MKSLADYLPKQIKSDGSLFGISLNAIQENRCPFCNHRLYKPLNKNIRYCKSKECPCYIQSHIRFVTKK